MANSTSAKNSRGKLDDYRASTLDPFLAPLVEQLSIDQPADISAWLSDRLLSSLPPAAAAGGAGASIAAITSPPASPERKLRKEKANGSSIQTTTATTATSAAIAAVSSSTASFVDEAFYIDASTGERIESDTNKSESLSPSELSKLILPQPYHQPFHQQQQQQHQQEQQVYNNSQVSC
jgi:hypothetical protein